MGIRELRVEASKLGIKNYSKMNKAELQSAVDAAKGATPLDTDSYKPQHDVPVASNTADATQAKALINVAGRMIVVTPTDTVETIGAMLGTFSKPDARKVRRLLAASGLKAFASAPRKTGSLPVEKAA